MFRRVRLVALCGILVVVLTAATGTSSFDVTYLLATAGLGTIVVGARHVIVRDRQRERWEYRTDTALWGPEDANGKRNVQAGAVAMIALTNRDVSALRGEVQELAKAANRAADAALAAAIGNHTGLADRRRSDD